MSSKLGLHLNVFLTMYELHKKKNNFSYNRNLLLIIGLVGVGIPVISIYLGYLIGNRYAPAKNIMPDRDVVVESSQLNMSLYNTKHITVHFSGGLGAQMFQYAALYGIAKANGLKAIMSSEENAKSSISYIFPYLEAETTEVTHPGKYYAKFREHKTNAFDQRTFSLNYMRDIELDGMFQSWRYFDHVRREIRSQFSFSQTAVNIVQEFLHKSHAKLAGFRRPNTNVANTYSLEEYPLQYIGMHVRRGDILNEPNSHHGYLAADKNYLSVSMQYFVHKYKNVIFVVASDDLDWCRANLSLHDNLVVFSTYEHHGLDLCLLSQCNHTIITVGAFGWWGAWLAGGETLYYRNFPRDGSPMFEDFRRTDYYLSPWIAL